MRLFDRCFRCGQPGHLSRNCPTREKKEHPPASGFAQPVRWEPPPPPADRHAYPADHWLLYRCPFCGRAPFRQCINVGTGLDRPPHDARAELIRNLA